MSLEAQDSLTTRTTRGHLILLFFVILVQANDHPAKVKKIEKIFFIIFANFLKQ